MMYALLAAATIPTPSPAQLRYMATDFIALIHFNMGTFAHNGDPCCDATNWDVKAPYATGKTRDPATFNPVKLNTTQWFDSINALGANIAILTAKHGCGFLLWPTAATLPDGSAYGYNVGAKGAAIQRDVLREFVDAADAAGVGYGFYYSIMKSFYLCHSYSGTNSCGEKILAGQHNVSAAEYKAIVDTHVREIWQNYGSMTEVWVDSQLGGFGDLMDQLQPQAVGTPRNPTGWCGTESGHPTRDVGGADVWLTGDGYHGDPDSPKFNPKFCDPQLFEAHVWFWEPNLKVRSLAEMVPIYHDIVGRGMVMELAFSIDRDGLVEDTHAATYSALGSWVQRCYGTPVASTSGRGSTLALAALPAAADRVQLIEDVAEGQRVRNYTLEVRAPNASSWAPLVSASAIGRKRIHLLASPVAAGAALRLRVTNATAPPVLAQFAAFAAAPCAV